MGILFPYGAKASELKLTGYCDSDFGGDVVERRSTSGYIFFVNKAPISWCSKKQSVVALSSCEAEYIAACYAACQGTWLKELLNALKIIDESSVKLMMDNTSAINLARNPISHGRSKHIEVKFHYLRDMVNKGKVEVAYCRTEEQLGDLFTKALTGCRFDFLNEGVGVVSL